MAVHDKWRFDPTKFSGTTRLFPLPNLVLFPHVLQPLHVFESRFRDLVAEALRTDRLVALALLAPGWESDYEGRPPVHPVACLGRVATYRHLKDGRYNLLLHGVRRISLVRELPAAKPFREAVVELLDDRYPEAGAAERPALAQALTERFKRFLPEVRESHEQFQQLLASGLSLGVLTDIVAYTLDVGLELKQQLLGELDVDRRATMLLQRLGAATCDLMARRARSVSFPPEFSAN